MFKLYKAEKVNIGEPKPIKHTELKLVQSKKKGNDMQTNESSDGNISHVSVDTPDVIKEAKLLYAEIIDEANAEAIKILENAKEEIEKRKKEECEKAYQEGFEKGYHEGKLEADSIITQAMEVKSHLEDRKNEIFKESEEELINIVIEASKKIIGQELQQNNEAIISLIKQALDKSAFKNNISIKVSSEDYKYVLENKEFIESLVEGVSEIDIIEDKFLLKGDCIIDTPGGQVNSSAQLQMEELEKAFLFVLRNE